MKLIIKMFAVAGVFILLDSIESIGVSVDNFWPTAVIAAILLGVLSLVIKPIISFFTFPITFLTLGLFTLVVNAFFFWLASIFIEGVEIRSFVAAFFGAIIMSIISWATNQAFDGDKD